MKELEKIVDSNGEPLEIVDAEAREDISEIKQSLSDFETLEKTASGAIATFDDGSALPMPKLEVAIEPQQDLHGYDAPWVGGAGKNKCDLSAFNHTGIADDEGGKTTLNNRLFSVHIPIKSDTTYTLSLTGSKNGENIYANRIIYFDSNDTFIERYVPSAPQIQTASFTTLSNAKYIQIDLRTVSLLGIEITDISKIQVEEGSTATSYAPYSNICPISGWDEVDVSVTGVNIWDEEWEVGGITDSGAYAPTQTIRSKNYNNIKPNTTYRIVMVGGSIAMRACFYDKNKNFISRTTNAVDVFTTPSNCYYFKLTGSVSYGDTYHNDISVNYPSTDTEYHAYNGHTYTIDLDGTRYGGTLDVVSGLLTITDGYIASYNSETLPSTWISDRDVYAEGTTPTVGAEVVYKLATPQTIQLTPTQVKSLLGDNNVWADTGNIELTYLTNNPLTQTVYDMVKILVEQST